jgi:hypothetical protein
MKSNIVLQMDVKDFEALTNTYMAFDKSWDKQIKQGRFEGLDSRPDFSNIYWFDNAVSLIIAKSYLASIGQDFKEVYDNNLDAGYSLITNFNVFPAVTNAS